MPNFGSEKTEFSNCQIFPMIHVVYTIANSTGIHRLHRDLRRHGAQNFKLTYLREFLEFEALLADLSVSSGSFFLI